MFKKPLLSIYIILACTYSWGQTSNQKKDAETQLSFFDVMPATSGLLSNMVIDSQVTTAKVGSYTRVNMHLGCYATNLRSIGNPVADNSIVTAYIDAYKSGGGMRTIQVSFPSDFLKPESQRMASEAYAKSFISVDAASTDVKWNATGNTIQLLIPNMKEVTITSDGEVGNVSEKNLVIAGFRFGQGNLPDRPYVEPYYGNVGPLSSKISWYTSVDSKVVDVYADFPGAAFLGQRAVYQGETRTGFCGGYYSPIMLFFDDNTPQFTATSNFSLAKTQPGKIYWPEAGSSGYFLVVDEKNNSQILNGSQMFGDTEKFASGFENLASYDLNKDGIIDGKDKIFKSLKLWNDKNADGISQKDELKTLKEMGVTSINLKVINETKKFGDRAEYKERSDFKFKMNGKRKTGIVLDMWFSPAPIDK